MQIGQSRANKTVVHKGKNLKLDALMHRQPSNGVPNESRYMGKLQDATHNMGGGVEDRLKLKDIERGKAKVE